MDLSYIERVAREIAGVLKPGQYRVIVDKSTVPVKTGEKVADTIRRYNKQGADFDVVSNPEFLREGCAVPDLMKPDRIVIGGNSERAQLVKLNPLYHYLELVRGPLTGKPFDPQHWYVVIGCTIVGLALTLVLMKQFRSRVAYWV